MTSEAHRGNQQLIANVSHITSKEQSKRNYTWEGGYSQTVFREAEGKDFY